MMILRERFFTLCRSFSEDEVSINEAWWELETAYSAEGRYYHTLEHVAYMFQELSTAGLEESAVSFAVFYHDAVYDVRREDNEAESALLAQKRLLLLDVGSATVRRVATMIVATKTHETDDPETALFLDADLAILGADAYSYEKYARNIRKEYAVFDDMTYRQGRKAVLRYFLQKPRIYLSDSFYNQYEEKARVNLHRELDMLCAGS